MKILKRILFVLLCIVLFFASIYATRLVFRAIYPLKYDNYIEEYSKEYNLDKYLVMSMIKVESNYDEKANSGKAKGLMQLTDETSNMIAKNLFADYKAELVYDPKTNIAMGCYYIRYLCDYYNDNIQLVLAAYNAGMGNVDKWLKEPNHNEDSLVHDNIPFPETKTYLEKIQRTKSMYQKLYKK